MKLFLYRKSTYGWLTLLFCCLFLASPLHATEFKEEVSTQDYLFAKGIIRSVSTDDSTITFKQKKGPNISVSIDETTTFEGFYKLEELKPRQQIKVWYTPDNQKNRALKIQKPLDLGC